jgi:ActR/RegA family two-component response regulator
MPSGGIRLRASAVERVLIIDRSPVSTADLAREIERRGCLAIVMADVPSAVLRARREPFAAIVLAGGLDPETRDLALPLLRALACGEPSIAVLLDGTARAARSGAALLSADEIMLAAIPPARLADALGLVGQTADGLDGLLDRAA